MSGETKLPADDLVERMNDLERHLLAEAQHTSGRKAVTVAYARAEAAAIAATTIASIQAQVARWSKAADEDWASAFERMRVQGIATEAEVTRLRQRVEEQGKTLGALPSRLDAKGCYEAAQIVRDALFAAGARKEPNNV